MGGAIRVGGWSDQFQTLLIKKQTHTGAGAAECFITKKLKTAVRSQFVKTSSAKNSHNSSTRKHLLVHTLRSPPAAGRFERTTRETSENNFICKKFKRARCERHASQRYTTHTPPSPEPAAPPAVCHPLHGTPLEVKGQSSLWRERSRLK